MSRPAPVPLLLALFALAAPAEADLNLPERTIVVRDFARRQQDLLDTLRVNVPDASIEINQFRGAEVVLQVTLDAPEPLPDVADAEARLRRHCDGLIRRAFPGMRLSADSLFLLRGPEQRAKSRSTDLVGRLRGALARITGSDSDTEGQDQPGEPGDVDPETAGMDPTTVDTGAEHRYRQLLAEKRAAARAAVRASLAEVPSPAPQAPPPAPSPPGPAGAMVADPEKPLLSAGTAEAMARFPARLAPEPSSEARQKLVHMAEQRDLLDRLKRSRDVSTTTLSELQRFQETGGVPVTSEETVARIYSQIFEDRRRAAEPTEAVVQLAEPILTAPPKGEGPEPIAVGRAPGSDSIWGDGAFGREVESLLQAPRAGPGAPLGLSMVGFHAPSEGDEGSEEAR